jgi:hypothetical protein
MSIENDLQALTKAIESNSAAVLLLAAKLNSTSIAPISTETAVETVAVVEKKVAPVVEKKVAAKVEKKAAPVEVVEEELEELEEVVEPTGFSLPAGVRNEKFYEKHVLPVTSKLGQMDKDALIKLIKGVFKSPKGGREIDSALWDSLVEQSQQAIDAIEKEQDDQLA